MPKHPLNELNHQKLLVAPSILASDFSILGDEIKRVTDAGCDLIHLDVMDGHFVPNLTIGPPIVKSIRKVTEQSFDTHLMITDPLKYAKPFADAGSDHITFHVECSGNPDEVIEHIHGLGCSAGICLKPKTPAETVLPYLDKIELVLVMTVEPGFGGQSFMGGMMPKVQTIRDEITKRNLQVHLEVDGGIDKDTVDTAAKAGANMMVAGTSVFRNPNGAETAIAQLHEAQKNLIV